MEKTLENWEVESHIDRTHPMSPWPVFRLTWMEKPKDEIEPVRQLMDAVPDLLAALRPFAYLAEVMEEGQFLNFRGVYVSYFDAKAAEAAIAKAKGS